MKYLLKHILLIILALVYLNNAKDQSSSEGSGDFSEIYAEYISVVEQDTFFSSPQTLLCPPRQVSSLAVSRVQNSGRRHDSSGRQNFEFLNSAKTIFSGLDHMARNKSSISYSAVMKPGNILVALCRFII